MLKLSYWRKTNIAGIDQLKTCKRPKKELKNILHLRGSRLVVQVMQVSTTHYYRPFFNTASFAFMHGY